MVSVLRFVVFHFDSWIILSTMTKKNTLNVLNVRISVFENIIEKQVYPFYYN